jgi:hypothetical protein
MKLFLVSQDENSAYDTYSSFVVCSEGEEMARHTNPKNGIQMTKEGWEDQFSTWASSPSKVKVKYLGEADHGVERGIICSSFNAG